MTTTSIRYVDGRVAEIDHHNEMDAAVLARPLENRPGVSLRVGQVCVYVTATTAERIVREVTQALRTGDAARPSAEVLREMSDYGRDLLETATALHRVQVAERSA
jgi:hypothetical protein